MLKQKVYRIRYLCGIDFYLPGSIRLSEYPLGHYDRLSLAISNRMESDSYYLRINPRPPFYG